MTAVLAVARAELRRGWRTLLLIGLVAGVVGAVVIGSLALARRTTTAYARLSEATGMDDARGLVTHHLDLLDEIAALPHVREGWTGRMGIAQVAGEQNYLGIVLGPEAPSSLHRPLVLEGRLPRDDGDPDTAEIALRDDFQRDVGLPLGLEVPVRFLVEEDYFRFDSGFTGGHPHGPEMTLRLVGTFRTAGGFGSVPPALGGPDLLAVPEIGLGGLWFADLVDGPRSLPGFTRAVEGLAADRTLPPEASEMSIVEVTDPGDAAAAVDHSAGLIGRGLLALALAVGGAGLLAVAQLCGRHNTSRAGEHAVEVALGLSRRERALARLVSGSLPAAVAVSVAGLGSVLASRIEPVGAVLRYETRTGPALNVAIAATGVLVVGLVVLAACVTVGVAGRQAASAPPIRPSRFAERVSRVGAAAETVVGLRLALEPGRGRRRVPVRGALVGVAVGVAGVVAGLVYAGSLDRLLASPSRVGAPYDVLVSDVTDETLPAVLDEPLAGDVALVQSSSLRIGETTVMGYAYEEQRGDFALDLAAGRLPAADDEVAIGLRIAEELGVGAGDTLRVTGVDGEEHLLAIVGTAVIPPLASEDLGLSVVLSSRGLRALAPTSPFRSAAVEVRPGGDADELVARMGSAFEAHAPVPPIEVLNLSLLGSLPDLVSAMIGAIALVALVHALAVVVRRRSTDLALLRTVGCTSRQNGAAIVVMALTLSVIGLLVGIPLGLAAGAALWRVTAEGAYVSPDPLVRWALVALLAAVTVVVALLAAALPARRAAQLPPATLLRVE